MSRLGSASLIASSAGTFSLLADLASLLLSECGQATAVLDNVLTVANLIGFLLGLLSRGRDRCRCAAAGLHLSWVPLLVVCVLLAAYEPALAAELVRRVAAVVLDVFAALVRVLVELAS